MPINHKIQVGWPMLIGLALAAMPFWGLPLLWIIPKINPPSQSDIDCKKVEQIMENAAQCLAYPHMWKRWEEISSIYNIKSVRNAQTCPQYISSSQQIQGEKPLLAPIIEYLQSNQEEGFNDAVKAVYKTNFCNLAKTMGWTAHD